MTNLWAEASRDITAEREEAQRATARVAVAPFWPMLAQATSEREFGHRLAVVKDQMLEALRTAQVTSARFQEETFEALAEDFRLLAASRKTASGWTQVTEEGADYPQWEKEVSGGALQVKDNGNGRFAWNFVSSQGYYTGGSGTASSLEEAKAAAEASVHTASRKVATATPDDVLKAIRDKDPDGKESEPTEQAYEAFEAWVKKVHGEQAWKDYNSGWDERTAARRKVAYGDVKVGDQVIWTDMATPDFSGDDPQLITYKGRNGEPWTVISIQRLQDYYWDKNPGGGNYWDSSDEKQIAEAWIEEYGAYRGISKEAYDLEVAVIERNGATRVVPVVSLSRSSVEVGKGQGVLPGLKGAASRKTAGEVTEDEQPECSNPGGHRFLGTAAEQPCIYCGVRSTKERPDNLDFREASASRKTAGEVGTGWMESEWADDGETKVVTVPGREGYLVLDVYPDEIEPGEWAWTIKPAYPLSEYPEVYDLGFEGSKDAAKAAAEAKVPAAITSYSSRKTAKDRGWLTEEPNALERSMIRAHDAGKHEGVPGMYMTCWKCKPPSGTTATRKQAGGGGKGVQALRECIAAGTHLKDKDADGYCNVCEWATTEEEFRAKEEKNASRKTAGEVGTGWDAIDEAGLHAGPENCSQGNPACNWGWTSKDGKDVYRCSVHGTEQAKVDSSAPNKTSRLRVATAALKRVAWAQSSEINVGDRVVVMDTDEDIDDDGTVKEVGPGFVLVEFHDSYGDWTLEVRDDDGTRLIEPVSRAAHLGFAQGYFVQGGILDKVRDRVQDAGDVLRGRPRRVRPNPDNVSPGPDAFSGETAADVEEIKDDMERRRSQGAHRRTAISACKHCGGIASGDQCMDCGEPQ